MPFKDNGSSLQGSQAYADFLPKMYLELRDVLEFGRRATWAYQRGKMRTYGGMQACLATAVVGVYGLQGRGVHIERALVRSSHAR